MSQVNKEERAQIIQLALKQVRDMEMVVLIWSQLVKMKTTQSISGKITWHIQGAGKMCV